MLKDYQEYFFTTRAERNKKLKTITNVFDIRYLARGFSESFHISVCSAFHLRMKAYFWNICVYKLIASLMIDKILV